MQTRTAPVFSEHTGIGNVEELVTLLEERDILDPATIDIVPTLGAKLSNQAHEWAHARYCTRDLAEDDFRAEVRYEGNGIWSYSYPVWQQEYDRWGNAHGKATLTRATEFGFLNRQAALWEAVHDGFFRFHAFCAPACDLARELPDGHYRRMNPLGDDDALFALDVRAPSQTLRERKQRAPREKKATPGKPREKRERIFGDPALLFA